MIVSYKTYRKFLEKNNHNKLHRFCEISMSKNLPYDLISNINELFDNIDNVEINEPIKYECSNISNEYNYEYDFSTKNGNEYRLDFVKLKEEQPTDKDKIELDKIENGIKKNDKNPIFYKQYIHDERLIGKIYVSISFSIKNATEYNYDIKTERHESIEVINNVLCIIKHFIEKYPDYIYMFADPQDNKKMEIYSNIVSKCFSEYEIVCDFTSGFPKTNIGYYLIK